MLVNGKKNGVIVVEKLNHGSEYVANIVPRPQLNWLHVLMQLGIGHERKWSMMREFSKIFKLAYKELHD